MEQIWQPTVPSLQTLSLHVGCTDASAVLYPHRNTCLASSLTYSLVVLSVDILVNGAQADLSGKDKDLNTPLHLAISKVRKNELQMLLLPAVTIGVRPQGLSPWLRGSMGSITK